jgi:hypothetical protein
MCTLPFLNPCQPLASGAALPLVNSWCLPRLHSGMSTRCTFPLDKTLQGKVCRPTGTSRQDHRNISGQEGSFHLSLTGRNRSICQTMTRLDSGWGLLLSSRKFRHRIRGTPGRALQGTCSRQPWRGSSPCPCTGIYPLRHSAPARPPWSNPSPCSPCRNRSRIQRRTARCNPRRLDLPRS